VEKMKNISNLQVYKKADVPKELYYSASDLIAPIVAVSDIGYELNDKLVNYTYSRKGAHGYNNTILEMRAMFLGNKIL
jgi:ectonucleotide pyrophosphatase/phosphodiesterase family protein 5